MPVELKSAKIKVVIETEQAQEQAAGLERRTKEVERKNERVRREVEETQKKVARGSPFDRATRRQLMHGQIAGAAKTLLTSLPLVGVGFGAGYAVGNVTERYGPAVGAAMKAFEEEMLPKAVAKALRALGIDPEKLADKASATVTDIKGLLQPLGQAGAATRAILASIAATGSPITGPEALDELKAQIHMARWAYFLNASRRRKLNELAGEGFGKAMGSYMRKALLKHGVGR